jgi:hypothetical protein
MGGEAWARTFRSLPAAEQRAIVTKLIATRVRYYNRLAGRPDPTFLTCDVRPAKGGGYDLIEGTERPLLVELGGDGRGLEAIGAEAACPDSNHPDLQMAAERIRAQLRAIDPDHPLLNPRRDPPPAKKRA